MGQLRSCQRQGQSLTPCLSWLVLPLNTGARLQTSRIALVFPMLKSPYELIVSARLAQGRSFASVLWLQIKDTAVGGLCAMALVIGASMDIVSMNQATRAVHGLTDSVALVAKPTNCFTPLALLFCIWVLLTACGRVREVQSILNRFPEIDPADLPRHFSGRRLPGALAFFFGIWLCSQQTPWISHQVLKQRIVERGYEVCASVPMHWGSGGEDHRSAPAYLVSSQCDRLEIQPLILANFSTRTAANLLSQGHYRLCSVGPRGYLFKPDCPENDLIPGL